METTIHTNTDFTEETRGYIWTDRHGDEWRCSSTGWWEYWVHADIWDPSTNGNRLPYADRAPFTRGEEYTAPEPKQHVHFRNL